MSLFYSFCLRQFCSPLFGLCRIVPGFVEFDQVTDFETSAFNYFEHKSLRLIIQRLLLKKHSQFMRRNKSIMNYSTTLLIIVFSQ